MTATNHVVTGALIATYLHNPWLAIPIAFASHFALDAIPHASFPATDNKEHLRFLMILAVDMAVAASILMSLLVLQPPNFVLLIACGVAAASPDLMWLYYIIIKKSREKEKWPAIAKFHARIQKESPRFIVIEVVWFIVAGGLLATRLY